MEAAMSKWLNGRLKDKSAVQHTLFATEDLAISALSKAVEAHKRKGHTVSEKWDGPKLRYEVVDHDGFVATYWLSDVSDSEHPYSHSSL
jgi:hypothetical protein